MHRLLKRIAPAGAPDAIWLEPTLATTSRAAALRTHAITSGAASAKRPISVIDAHLVALAEVRSTINAVTILTSDRTDIQILVNLTGAKNVSVQICESLTHLATALGIAACERGRRVRFTTLAASRTS